MARGDLIVFEESKKEIIMGGWEAADEIWIGLVTETCLVGDPDPHYAAGGTTNYTAIATAGEYAAGGLLLDTLTAMLAEAAGVVTFDDTGASVTWAQNAASPQNADHAVIYHKTTGHCLVMIDLDGPIDMKAGDLTITWHGNGIFTFE